MKKAQLFLLHFAGGNRYSFQFLAPHLLDFEFIPLELPGRGRRHAEALLLDLEAAAADICQQINGVLETDYVLYGHSMGSLLALRVAALLEAQGKPPRCVVVSGNAGPGSSRGHKRYLLPKPALKAELQRLGGVAPEFLEHEELFDFYEPILRADFQLVEDGNALSFSPIQAPLYALMGEDEATSGEIGNWARFTQAGLSTRLLPGGHFFINQHAGELARIIQSCYGARREAPTLPAPHTR
jgi:external thioesterase TEII